MRIAYSVVEKGSGTRYNAKYWFWIGKSIVLFKIYTDTAQRYEIDLTTTCSNPHEGR